HVPVAVSTAGVLSGVIVTQIGMGGREGCAVSSAGAAYCWGSGTSGQLGNNLAADSRVPVAVTAAGARMAGAVLIQVLPGSGTFACAVSTAGAAYCWGADANGQLGNNSTTQANVPVAVSVAGVLAGVTLIQITGGNASTCAMDGTGAAYCWGLNSSGQVGNPVTGINFLVPVTVAAAQPTTISAGATHSCMLRSGKAYCWGDNTYGQLGNKSTISSSVPVAVYTGGVLSGVTLTQISAGDFATCALSSTGAAYCWGYNAS